MKKILWEYRNAWQYSFWGWLNPIWHSNFWYNMIFSYNGWYVANPREGKPYHKGWKGKLNYSFHWYGVTWLLCKLKGYKVGNFSERIF